MLFGLTSTGLDVTITTVVVVVARVSIEKGKERNMSLLQEVKDYALEHYNDGGWDVIVETYEDCELAEEIKGVKTLAGALRRLRPLVAVWSDQQADAQNSIW